MKGVRGAAVTTLCFQVGVYVLQTTLEATQRQIDGFFSQFFSKCYLSEVASVGD